MKYPKNNYNDNDDNANYDAGGGGDGESNDSKMTSGRSSKDLSNDELERLREYYGPYLNSLLLLNTDDIVDDDQSRIPKGDKVQTAKQSQTVFTADLSSNPFRRNSQTPSASSSIAITNPKYVDRPGLNHNNEYDNNNANNNPPVTFLPLSGHEADKDDDDRGADNPGEIPWTSVNIGDDEEGNGSDICSSSTNMPGPRTSSLISSQFNILHLMSESGLATEARDSTSTSNSQSDSSSSERRSATVTKTPIVVLRRTRLPWAESSDSEGEDQFSSEDENASTIGTAASTPSAIVPFPSKTAQFGWDELSKNTNSSSINAKASPLNDGRPTRKRLIIFSLVFIIAAGLAIFLGLYFSGKFENRSGRQKLQTRMMNASNGAYGCSNRPIRAPLTSRDVQEISFGPLLSCPANNDRYTLTECDLLATLRPLPSPPSPQSYLNSTLRRYLPHLVRAMEAYDLNCSPERVAAFLATVRHETNGMLSMLQPIDGGAGAVHLLPAYFSMAISEIPPLRQAYEQQFGSKYPLSRLTETVRTDLAFRQQVGQLIARAEFTFLVAGWWMVSGSRQVLGAQFGCSDLRLDMDKGLGSATAVGNTKSTATGFYHLTQCIYGTIQDPGLPQRVQYYRAIRQYAFEKMKCQTVECFQ